MNTAESLADIKSIEHTLQVGSKVVLYMTDEFEVYATLEYDSCNLVWLGLPDWTTIQYFREESERTKVIASITAAFANVSREDGITLHEARVIDDYGSATEQFKARELDTDTEWRHVPENVISKYSTSINFVDHKGFRYYIPAYIIWSLNKFSHANSSSVDATILALSLKNKWCRDTSWTMLKFSILTKAQSQAVCRFLKYMANQRGYSDDATEALADYWHKFDL